MSTFVVDSISGLIGLNDFSVEKSDEQKDGKNETEKEDQVIKDKYFTHSYSYINVIPQAEKSYLEHIFSLPKPYTSRIDLPPKQA